MFEGFHAPKAAHTQGLQWIPSLLRRGSHPPRVSHQGKGCGADRERARQNALLVVLSTTPHGHSCTNCNAGCDAHGNIVQSDPEGYPNGNPHPHNAALAFSGPFARLSCLHIPLGPLRSGASDPPPLVFPARSGRPISHQIHVPLPLSETFELISNFDQRLLWNRGVDELKYDPDRVNRVGTRHQCTIDGDTIHFETVTGGFGPDRLVYCERILAETPVLDPTPYFILEEDGAGTRVCAEVHYQPKPFPKSLLAILFRWGFSRRLPKSLAAIAEGGEGRTEF